ncbi:MAG: NPCBM/NEW2 domain-containing protein [Betaproteobacteria bacterium]
MSRPHLPILIAGILTLTLSACSDKKEVVTSGAPAKPAPTASAPTAAAPAAEPTVPQVDAAGTKALFARLTLKEPGDKVGVVELRPEGILLHPGDSRPTVVEFDLKGLASPLALRFFMAPLPPDALGIKDAGTVQVEAMVDGKLLWKEAVGRGRGLDRGLDVAGATKLRLIVDNADGKSWFDWLMFGVAAK